jgi:hypothetical protein
VSDWFLPGTATYYKIHGVVKYYEMEVKGSAGVGDGDGGGDAGAGSGGSSDSSGSRSSRSRFSRDSPYVSVHHVQGPSEINYNEQILPLGIFLYKMMARQGPVPGTAAAIATATATGLGEAGAVSAAPSSYHPLHTSALPIMEYLAPNCAT